MPASHILVRLPSHGMLLGEAVARHPGAVVSCVPSGHHEHPGRSVLDHVALVEGLPDSEVASLLLAWGPRYGEDPQVLGGPFALRLPMALDMTHPPAVAACLALAPHMPGLTQRVAGDILELWAPCAIQDAARVLARLRQAAVGLPVLGVESGTPSAADLECWDLLRSVAAGLVPDCLVAT